MFVTIQWGKLRGWGNISVGGVFCISWTVGKYNVFVKFVIAVKGI